MEEEKSFRQIAKEAKSRLKSGFWKEHYENLEQKVQQASEDGLNTSKVVEYYHNKIATTIKGIKSEEELFYIKVKEILDKEGEVTDMIARLTDKEYYNSLSYDQKQKYWMEISDKYRKALERYKKELQFENTQAK